METKKERGRMHGNRERERREGKGNQGRGEKRQGGKRFAAAAAAAYRCFCCERPVLLSEVFLLEDGGIAGGMKGAGLWVL